MQPIIYIASAVALAVSLALPALAGTIPPAELAPGKTTLEASLIHAAFDRAYTPDLTIGAMGYYFPHWVVGAAVRGSYNLYRSPHLAVAGVLSGGVTSVDGDMFELGWEVPWDTRTWIQPALNVSASLLPEPSGFNVRLRATAGPIINLLWVPSTQRASAAQPPGLFDPLVWPNLELAVQLWPACEVAVGFPDVASLRLTW
jgi:hypothetical protein